MEPVNALEPMAQQPCALWLGSGWCAAAIDAQPSPDPVGSSPGASSSDAWSIYMDAPGAADEFDLALACWGLPNTGAGLASTGSGLSCDSLTEPLPDLLLLPDADPSALTPRSSLCDVAAAAAAGAAAASPHAAAPGRAAAKRRGRPPKTPGVYSRGYEAIVAAMEAEIEAKRAAAAALAAENGALRRRHAGMEAHASALEDVLHHAPALAGDADAAALARAGALAGRYRALIEAGAGALAARDGAPAPRGAPLPFSVEESLLLAALDRSAEALTARAGAAPPAEGATPALDVRTGAVCWVGDAAWARATAAAVTLAPGQAEALAELLRCADATRDALAAARGALLRQLRGAAADGGADAGWACVCAVERHMTACRAAATAEFWALARALEPEQLLAACVASYPALPLAGLPAVARVLLAASLFPWQSSQEASASWRLLFPGLQTCALGGGASGDLRAVAALVGAAPSGGAGGGGGAAAMARDSPFGRLGLADFLAAPGAGAQGGGGGGCAAAAGGVAALVPAATPEDSAAALAQIQAAQAQLRAHGAAAAQAPRQPARRGRPPRDPSTWSKAYVSIRRYRDKQKSLVQQLEETVAARRAQLAGLAAEQAALVRKEQHLQTTLCMIDSTITQLDALNLELDGSRRTASQSSVSGGGGGACGGGDGACDGDSARAAAPARQCSVGGGGGGGGGGRAPLPPAPLLRLPSSSSSSSSGSCLADDRAAAAEVASRVSAELALQQSTQAQAACDVVALTRRYQAYLQVVAARLATLAALEATLSSQEQADGGAAQAGAAGAAGARPKPRARGSKAPRGARAPQPGPGGGQAAPGPPPPGPLARTGSGSGSGNRAAVAAAVAAAAAAADDDSAAAAAVGEGGPGADATGFPPLPLSIVEIIALWNIHKTAVTPEAGPVPRVMAYNIETREHEPLPEGFWARVAQQVPLRPEQRAQLEGAWSVFAAALAKVNQERRELQRQLDEVEAAALGLPAAAAGAAAAAAAAPGAAGASPGASAPFLSLSGAGQVLERYLALVDAIERSLVRGRVLLLVYGQSLKVMLDNEQFARICVASYPIFPLLRAVVGHLIGVPELANT
ncbi:hypothetical protein HT031_002712 [Scenedesmus sp. PABB004]|nr:hypothetical protein HT031_002712 [Scenedesmus sp. PABB004]